MFNRGLLTSLLLLGLAGWFILAMMITLFIPSTSGGTLFAEAWPYLLGPLVVLLLLSASVAIYSRRKPEAWLFRSIWPAIVGVILFGAAPAAILVSIVV